MIEMNPSHPSGMAFLDSHDDDCTEDENTERHATLGRMLEMLTVQSQTVTVRLSSGERRALHFVKTPNPDSEWMHDAFGGIAEAFGSSVVLVPPFDEAQLVTMTGTHQLDRTDVISMTSIASILVGEQVSLES